MQCNIIYQYKITAFICGLVQYMITLNRLLQLNMKEKNAPRKFLLNISDFIFAPFCHFSAAQNPWCCSFMLRISWQRLSDISQTEHYSASTFERKILPEMELIPDMEQQNQISLLLLCHVMSICQSLLWTWMKTSFQVRSPPFSLIFSTFNRSILDTQCILTYVTEADQRKCYMQSEELFLNFFLWAVSVLHAADAPWAPRVLDTPHVFEVFCILQSAHCLIEGSL